MGRLVFDVVIGGSRWFRWGLCVLFVMLFSCANAMAQDGVARGVRVTVLDAVRSASLDTHCNAVRDVRGNALRNVPREASRDIQPDAADGSEGEGVLRDVSTSAEGSSSESGAARSASSEAASGDASSAELSVELRDGSEGLAGGSSVPQANLAVTFGVTGRDSFGSARVHLGVRGDVLFGRSGPLDFGFGPYAEAMTAWDDVSLGGGASVLFPVHEYLPFVLSLGGYGRYDSGWEPGVTGQIFWGVRNFNYGGWYGMAAGLSVQGRVGIGDGAERAVVIAAHVDLEALALPFVAAVNAIRGTGD